MNIAALILAAGEGTRMKSDTPKVFHKVNGTPIIERILSISEPLCNKRGLILGRTFNEMKVAFNKYPSLELFHQKERLGTGHAVMCASEFYKNYDGYIMILPGDTPLLTEETLKEFINFSESAETDCCILGFRTDSPSGYGRIVEDHSQFIKIVEEKDASEEEKRINLVNSGIIIIRASLINKYINQLSSNNAQKEYYLTDLPSLLLINKYKVCVFSTDNETDFMGVNNRIQLSLADSIANMRHIESLMIQGVTVYNPTTVRIESTVNVGRDTVIFPGCILTGETQIGEKCTIKSGSVIHNSNIANSCEIKPYSVIENSTINSNCAIGPMAHLRPGTDLDNDVKIGNFVETKKAKLHKGVKASHLTYLGDTEIGEHSNIGAGTITCNYDGENKHKTVIGRYSFIGSDTQLVAPVTVGNGAYVAAGSTITKDVPECSLGISRTKQTNIKDWAKRKGKKCPQN